MFTGLFLERFRRSALNEALSRRPQSKRERAFALIEHEDIGVSAQVLQEFYVTATRKIEIPMTSEQALEWVEQLEAFPCLSVDASLVKIAAEVSERYRISCRDGAIVSAAHG